MNEFVASNGYRVVAGDGTGFRLFTPLRGEIGVGWIPEERKALREFFLAERDAELGRWRSKEHPDCVARVHEAGGWLFTDERTGASKHYSHRNRATVGTSVLSAVAREFFAAHPEPKPWHDAKPGEVWVLTIDGTDAALLVDPSQFTDGNLGWDFDDPSIKAGRRIWPEVQS